MALLGMMQDVADLIGLPRPSSVIGSTDQQVRQLLAWAHEVGGDLRGMYNWPKLTKRGTITLVASQAAYALPADWDHDVNDTHWSSSQYWPMLGPLTPQEWEHLQNGISTVGTQTRFRNFGFSSSTFQINPTPTASDAGNTFVFEYQTTNWVRPATWTTGTVYAAGAYTFYNGYYFSTVAGGTSGATAPTPSGLNDGGVVWVLYSGEYSSYVADTDTTHFDEDLVNLGIRWNYLASKGLPYQHLEKKFYADARSGFAQQRGARTLSLVPRPSGLMLTPWNVPDSGFPTP